LGFRAWCDGRTGYPFIDAAMRQLRSTGWMHNRARMVVASFLAKDLGIDWRRGERFFMQRLVDGDPASNDGGWQWAASTGTDAQPWFRIFNPVAQGVRFDPQGTYVRRFVPELSRLEGAAAHEPWLSPERAPEYPPRIVHHAVGRQQALARYQTARARQKR
jgi:deoxyribodipyrimidine photo-lyase